MKQQEVDTFIFALTSIEPKGERGPKMSSKRTCTVEIVPDQLELDRLEAINKIFDLMKQQSSESWVGNIKKACMLAPQIDENEQIIDVTCGEAVMHFCSIGWKLLFALCPPSHVWGGWACFIVSLTMIGLITAIVGEVANLFGCVLGLKQAVTAITFVSLGTSLPDTFASKQAAQESEFADSAIGNVTGSNSVNVFLGLGFPWVIASIYYVSKVSPFET